jgi:hypothetical protein
MEISIDLYRRRRSTRFEANVAFRASVGRGDFTETNTVLFGIALGWGPWLLILGLALIEGIADRMLSMALVAAHARLLLVIPLIFISESWVTRMSACVATIARYGVVSPDDRPALDAEVSRTRRWANWWWPEVVCFVLFGN